MSSWVLHLFFPTLINPVWVLLYYERKKGAKKLEDVISTQYTAEVSRPNGSIWRLSMSIVEWGKK